MLLCLQYLHQCLRFKLGVAERRVVPMKLVYVIWFMGLTLLDQGLKLLVQKSLISLPSINLWGERFSLTYVRNYGAAFGMLDSQRFFLITVTATVFALVWINYKRLRQYPKLFHWGLVIALSGTLGNFIDRIHWGYVIDYIDVGFWPVFNLADINICVGAGLMIIGLLRENLHAPDNQNEGETVLASDEVQINEMIDTAASQGEEELLSDEEI